VKLLHKSVLAQKHRIDQLVEEVNLLTENPNTFDWTLKDQLRCLAIGIFREHAKKFADRTHGKFNLGEADNDKEDEIGWLEVGSVAPIAKVDVGAEADPGGLALKTPG
jgi:hypothetical protein